MLLQNSAPAKRRAALITGKLPELLMHGKMVHSAMALLLEPGMTGLAFKRTPAFVNRTDVLVQIELLGKSRRAHLA